MGGFAKNYFDRVTLDTVNPVDDVQWRIKGPPFGRTLQMGATSHLKSSTDDNSSPCLMPQSLDEEEKR